MKIWDFPTRAFHWALAIAIVVSFVSVRMDEMDVHFMSGSVVLALIIFRLIWGLIGPVTAQFHRFAPTPQRIKDWRAGGAIGHSPLGSLSVFALLGVIGAQAVSGLFTDDDIYLTGPLRNYVSSGFASDATKLHSQLAEVIFLLVLLHLAAIVFYVAIKKSDILKVLWTGSRTGATQGIQTRPFLWAISAACVAALISVYIFQFA